MDKNYLDPKQPLGIEPAAAGIVEGVDACCLDVRPKNSATMGKGRFRGAWWMIWIAMMGIVLDLFILVIYGQKYGAAAIAALLTIVVFGVSLLWPIQVWRGQRPVRFCRKDRKVYLHHYRKTYVADWDRIRAYLKVQHGVTAQGVPIQDGQVNMEFPYPGKTPYAIALLAPESLTSRPEHQAAALWEYIRTYMEEGPDNLPSPVLPEQDLEWDEILPVNNPLPIVRTKRPWVIPFEFGLFFPFRLTLFLITYPTDILYYFLAKHIKTKPFPPELERPCRCEEDQAAE